MWKYLLSGSISTCCTHTQYVHAYSRRFARSCESVNPAMMACTVRVHDINPCWTFSRSSDWVSHITLEIQSYIHIISHNPMNKWSMIGIDCDSISISLPLICALAAPSATAAPLV